MSGLFRAGLVLAGSIAVGSWLGLGRPNAEASRAMSRSLVDRVGPFASRFGVPVSPVSPSVEPDAGDSPSAPNGADDGSIGFGPLPNTNQRTARGQGQDAPTAAAPWPSLNPDASIPRAWMVAEGPARVPGDGRRFVTLTFDDGPFLETTPSVLRVLARYNVHATFFVIGQYLLGEDKRTRVTRALLRRAVAAGHLVGNHTMDHVHLAQIPRTKALAQIDDCSSAIEQAIGQRPILFRPPFGELDDFGSAAAHERGLDVMLWSVEANDMNRDDAHGIFTDLSTQLDYEEGGMVLLHDIRFSSVAALRELLAWLHEHRWDPKRPSRPGYEVVDLPTYLRAVNEAPLPFDTREELEKSREAASKLRHVRAPRESHESRESPELRRGGES